MSSSSPVHTGTARVLTHVWDVVLFALGALTTVIGIMNVPAAHVDGVLNGLGVLLVLVSTALWVGVFWRRRAPWVVVACGGLIALIGNEYLLGLIGVFHVLLTATWRTRIWTAAAASTAVFLFWLREVTTPWGSGLWQSSTGGPREEAAINAIIAIVSLSVTFGAAIVTVSRRAATSERRRADAQHALVEQLGDDLAKETERHQIAREIHDGLTNKLALLSMMGGNVERAVAQGSPDAPAMAHQLKSQSREALEELRGLVQELRSAPDAPVLPRGSMRGVGKLIAEARAAGTRVDAMVMLSDIDGATAALDGAVHRLAQECLTNAVKHAPGAVVTLYLEASPTSGVRLRVSNPLVVGVDRATSVGASSGTTGMRERVKALGGTVWIGDHQGAFIVDATLPWTRPAPRAATGAPMSPSGPTLGA
ncbi:sensor histidine kinase [Demequina sp.]|uniref:sensor histidine kinase n=1 Tax=Demequina sp. TaxID=2050685 RepID=UPI003A84D5DB